MPYQGTARVHQYLQPTHLHTRSQPGSSHVAKSHTRINTLAGVRCVQPADTDGYEIGLETLDVASFSVAVSCAPGYEGAAAATVCSSANTDYLLGGCVPVPGVNPVHLVKGQPVTLEACQLDLQCQCTYPLPRICITSLQHDQYAWRRRGT